MIAAATSPKWKASDEHQRRFVAMLPRITGMARKAFRDRDPEAREEACAEVVLAAFAMFAALLRQHREARIFPSALASYAIKRVKIGRLTATRMNVRDISSEYCQLRKGVRIERLDRCDAEGQAWKEVLVEDQRAGPAQIAATRLDFSAWLHTLPGRKRAITEQLSRGETTSRVAREFGVSAARISQLRRELKKSWETFVGDLPAAPPGAAGR